MSADATKHKSKTNPAMWAATIAGLLIGRYTGVDLLIPLVGAVVTFYALKRLASPKRSAWFPAIAIQTGHAIWFIVGLAILGQINANVIDPAFLLLGSLWLLLRPGTLPVVVLSVLQLAALSYNVYVFSGTAFGTNSNEALSVHIIFRALAVGFMLFAWFASRRAANAPVIAP